MANSIILYFFLEILLQFSKYLSWWEIEEIKFYDKIWFLGLGAPKTLVSKSPLDNFSFDKIGEEDEDFQHYDIVSIH